MRLGARWPRAGIVALVALTLAAGVTTSFATAGSRAASLTVHAPASDDSGSDGTVVDGPADGRQPMEEYRANPATPLTSAIDRLLGGEPGVYGVVLCDPDGTVLYRRNSEVPFVSASLYKLLLLVDIARAVDNGSLTLDTGLYVAPEYYDSIDGTDSYFDPGYAGYDTTVQEAMFATGAYSSNVAAKALLSVTTFEEVNGIAAELGLTGTSLFTGPDANPAWPPHLAIDTTVPDMATAQAIVESYAADGYVNLTTPADMARFFTLLLRGEVINSNVSGMVLDILEQQVVTDRFPALLPADVRLAHKTGNLDHVVHDVGIIYTPDGPVVLAAMVQGPADDGRAAQVIQRLALIAYGDLDVPPFDATPAAGASPVPAATPVAIPSDGTVPGGV